MTSQVFFSIESNVVSNTNTHWFHLWVKKRCVIRKIPNSGVTGHSLDGYSVRIGVPSGAKDHGFSFSLKIPDKMYVLSAHTEHDRDDWMEVIERVIEKPLTPQDSASK